MTTKKVKIETPEAEPAGKAAPKTSVGAKLMLDRIEELNDVVDRLLKEREEMVKDNKDLAIAGLDLLEGYTEAMQILSDASSLEVNIFSPKYYRDLAALQKSATLHIIDSFIKVQNLKGKI